MTETNIPLCPKCGNPMELRSSYRGVFWGCKLYPLCSEIIEYTYSTDTQDKTLPRKFSARPKSINKQVKFYESISAPQAVIDFLYLQAVDQLIISSAAQWRLDYTFPQEYNFPISHKAVFSVLEKILTRGRITLCSRNLEDYLNSKFPHTANEPLQNYIENLAFSKRCSYDYSNFQPEEESEQKFLNDIFIKKIGEQALPFITHQPEIYYLVNRSVSAKYKNQKADFLISYPKDIKVIVEIDGPQHDQQIAIDRARDTDLIASGYNVVRIPVQEVSRRDGPNLAKLLSLLTVLNNIPKRTTVSSLVISKIAHQIQLTLLNALQNNHLKLNQEVMWDILIDLPEEIHDYDVVSQALDIAVRDFLILMGEISKLYNVSIGDIKYKIQIYKHTKQFSDSQLFITFNGKQDERFKIVYSIQDIFIPFVLTTPRSKTEHYPIQNLDKEIAENMLRYIFRKESFWEGQWEALERILQHQDSLILMPTGSGKTIIFQLASFLMPGMAIVVDPLVSLIEDQVYNLALYGIDSAFYITSNLNVELKEESLDLLSEGEFLFYYVTPERFQRLNFQEKVKSLAERTCINIIVVDEVHCVSEWGHDFRPSYINLAKVTRACCKSGDYVLPIIGLTGTASHNVLRDVQRELEIMGKEAIITLHNFDRKELEFEVIKVPSNEKRERITHAYKSLPDYFNENAESFLKEQGENKKCGLIFFPFRQGRSRDITIQSARNYLDITHFYCGEKPSFFRGTDSEWLRFKKEMVIKYKNNSVQTLLCTKAFGMGIDKPNIRFTMHVCLPSSPESFYQEAGRAGRCRKKSYCFLLYSYDQKDAWEVFTNTKVPFEELSGKINDIKLFDDLRAIWYFHQTKFKGIKDEHEFLLQVISQFGDLSDTHSKTAYFKYQFTDEDKKYQIAFNRLRILGIIDGYAIDNNQYNVYINPIDKNKIIANLTNYIDQYQVGRSREYESRLDEVLSSDNLSFVRAVSECLISFIYDTIEVGRREAVRIMLEAVKDPAYFRSKILNYLTPDDKNDEDIDKILSDPDKVAAYILEIIERLRSKYDIERLKGRVDRRIAEDQPFNPGLRLLKGFLEIISQKPDFSIARNAFELGISYAIEKYKVDLINYVDGIALVCDRILKETRYNQDILLLLATLIQLIIENSIDKRQVARKLVKVLPLMLKVVPLKFLARNITNIVEETLLK